MSTGGWIFMIFSWLWIIGLLVWSFGRLMRNQHNRQDPPA
jgi:hypothetical protein